MNPFRRDFLKLMSQGTAGAAVATVLPPGVHEQAVPLRNPDAGESFDVKCYGARGDGTTIDTPAINRAIEAATALGGGTVRFLPAHTLVTPSVLLRDFSILQGGWFGILATGVDSLTIDDLKVAIAFQASESGYAPY